MTRLVSLNPSGNSGHLITTGPTTTGLFLMVSELFVSLMNLRSAFTASVAMVAKVAAAASASSRLAKRLVAAPSVK